MAGFFSIFTRRRRSPDTSQDAAPRVRSPAPLTTDPAEVHAAAAEAFALPDARPVPPAHAATDVDRRAAPGTTEATPDPEAAVAQAMQSARAAWEAGDAATAIRTLSDAAAHFPKAPELTRALARATTEVADWSAAETAWRLLLAQLPADAEAHAGHIAALRALGEAEAAEQAAATAVQALPDDPAIGAEYAQLAEARGDWPAAAERWRRLADAVPHAQQATLGHAVALQRLGDAVAAEAVLRTHVDRFPGDGTALHDLARLAERRQDWTLAERCWRAFNAVNLSNWWSFSSLANALARQDRSGEADAVLHDGLALFPGEPSLLADQVRILEARGDWDTAIRGWDDVIARFPATWVGYAGKIAALSRTGRQDEADAVLLRHGPALPDDGGALHDLARHAERRQDWPAAENAWRGFLRQDQSVDWAHQGLVVALVRQDRVDAAASALEAAMQRLQSNPCLLIEAARLADLRNQPDAAARHWREVGRLLPLSPTGPMGEAHMLAAGGDFDAAQTVLTAALARMPDEPALYEAQADIAVAADDAPQALRLLQAARQRFPAQASFADRIDDIKARLEAQADDPALITPEAEAAADQLREWLSGFESLGGSGPDDAITALQRAYGAEPLSLLQGAQATPEALAQALEADLSGLGSPEQSEIAVRADPPTAQYWITDRRFGIALPTQLTREAATPEEAARLTALRVGALRGKLLDDLRAARRMFVYTLGPHRPARAELERLRAACGRYGDNVLLCLCLADPDHPAGTVAWAGPGLLVGAIDGPAAASKPAEGASSSLLALCRLADALRRDRAAPAVSAQAAPDAATASLATGL